MDILQLYRDYGITFKTEGHKHCREGWVNITCPFCTGNPGYHLGYNFNSNAFVCWRCGSHPVKSTIATILQVSYRDAVSIIESYGGESIAVKKTEVNKLPFQLPSNTTDELGPAHLKYLIEERNFDPDLIKSIYDIKATHHSSTLDSIDYKWRIVMPVYWDNKIVTFTSRAIGKTLQGSDTLRYIACPENREIINIKKLLYGVPKYWGDLGICVEGTTDVWRLGPQSVATFGIKYKPAQVRLLSKYFKRVIVLYDDEIQAQKQARALAAEIRFRGVDAFTYTIQGDPGSLSDADAKHLVKTLQTYKVK